MSAGRGPGRLGVALVLMAAVHTAGGAEPVLGLTEATELALARDPSAARHAALARQREHQSVAEGQLPDPRLRFGALNLPTDSFALDQEPMTQLLIGVQQAFPPSGARANRAARSRSLAGAERARAAEQALATALAARQAWLEVYYWVRAAGIVERNRGLFQQLLAITQSAYSVGRADQQDVLRASLEFERLRDRLAQIAAREDDARAELAKWIGLQAAARPLPDTLQHPVEAPSRADLEQALAGHPVLTVEDAHIAAQRAELGLAESTYRPSWALDVSYGVRQGRDPSGGPRPDFGSVMLSLDLPLFTGKRQDQQVAAARESMNAARLARADRLRELRRQLDSTHANWRWLGERLELYRRALLPAARQNAEAALNGYQAGTTDFTALMRAYITVLETELQAAEVRVRRAQAQARLLYFSGEPT